MNPLTQSKNTKILPVLIALGLACFALSPAARAVLPPPDGGYPGGNTAEGNDALLSLSRGKYNTAVGFQALSGITIGDYNTAIGFQALINNSTGKNNTAVGSQALYSNRVSQHNTAIGFNALFSNTDGGGNTAAGESALYSNQFGGSNTAIGFDALLNNISSYNNTAIGASALGNNTEGYSNTATGVNALLVNRVGQYNTATGVASLLNNAGSNNTAVGYSALLGNTTGENSIAIGYEAGINLTTGNNNIDIGHAGVPGEANTIRIGTQGTQTKTFIAGISGVTVAGGVGVIVGTNGQLGTVVSSERFKDAIKPMDKASEAILALQPVTFRYKHELDPEGIPQFGLVAEEVEKVNPDLVARDADGKVYTVRYEAVNAMLLNEFLKEHREVQEQKATITQLKSTVAHQQKDFQATIAHQQKQIEALTAGLQRVSAQAEMSRPAPQTVVNNQ
jgi:hypothetical protein